MKKYLLFYDDTMYDGAEISFLGIFGSEEAARLRIPALEAPSRAFDRAYEKWRTETTSALKEAWEKHRHRVLLRQKHHNYGSSLTDAVDIIVCFLMEGHHITSGHAIYGALINFEELDKTPELSRQPPRHPVRPAPYRIFSRFHVEEVEDFSTEQPC